MLVLCPPGVRVAAWHRGARVTRSRYPLNAWEPVIYHGGRQLPPEPSSTSATDATSQRLDSLVHTPAPLLTLPGRVTGTKPAAFCRWVFALLGAAPGDSLDDLFPALEEQRNGEWRYLKFLQVRSLITAEIFLREIPGGTRARQQSRPVDLPEQRY